MDEIEIRSLQLKLENNPFFAALAIKEKYRKELSTGKYAMRFSFPDLIKKSQLSDELFIDRWKLYSNYAHSESIGLNQMRYYSQDTKSLNLTYFIAIMFPLMLMSCYFNDLLEQFKNYECEIGDIDDEAIIVMKFRVEMSTSKSKTV